MRTEMTRSVPGCSSAGRLRRTPWRCMYCISPCQPRSSHCSRWRSSSASSIPLMPIASKPSARASRSIALRSVCAAAALRRGGASDAVAVAEGLAAGAAAAAVGGAVDGAVGGAVVGSGGIRWRLWERQYNRLMTSPQLLYSVEQARALDAASIAAGTSGYTLMRRAGEAALRVLRSRWPRALQISVVTGGGNNGGDGYVLARFAQAAGLSVQVLAVVAPESLKGDARVACDEFHASSGRIQPYSE